METAQSRKTIAVLLFSVLRQKVGRGELEVDLDASITGTELLDYLAERFPVIEAYRPVIRLAVNQSYVSESVSLEAGDEVALITPVSGG